MPDFEVRPITAEETLSLRHAILRAGLPREMAIFPGDEAESSRHFGAFLDGKLVGVATIHFASLLDRPDFDPAYQVRGMATTPEVRGQGAGHALVEACMEAARAAGAHWIWCNARTPAVGFYTQHGFKPTTGVFDIPTAGPHMRMFRPL
ncbi:MAG: GNAT family N-acetyltransferase [Chthoniobacter sp.]|uniref:GNAT family N-acetyltransferase n=1 Tax=Chthoniobacter sp. TaxID=2510640 RepID=UPI0032A1F513